MATIALDASRIPATAPVFLTVKQFAATQPGLTEGAVRWDLFNRTTNGLSDSGAVIRRGRHLLIDPAKYLGWLASRTG